MTKRSTRKKSFSLPFLPKSRDGQLGVAVLSVCCVLLAAWYAATTATRSETAAKQFVANYQYIDQTAYRSTR